MQTNEWGPAGWKFLHSITFNYPNDPSETDKKHFKDLFESLQYVLPCSLCRSSFCKIFKYICIDYYLDSKEGLTFWLFIVHNLVNLKLNKNMEFFDDVVVKYENFRARCGSMNDIETYNKCKKELKPIEKSDIDNNVTITYAKYKDISKQLIQEFYNSNDVIDPNFNKCTK